MTEFTYKTPQSSSLPGCNVFDTDTQKNFGLGNRVTVHYGANSDLCADFVYIRAGAALTAGQLCELPKISGTDAYVVDVPLTTTLAATAAPDQFDKIACCIPQVDIPSGSYGWAAVKGDIEVLAAASASEGAKLYTTGTAGVLDDADTDYLVEDFVLVADNGGSQAKVLGHAFKDLNLYREAA